MVLTDDSRCKKVCSFVKHWDKKDGQRCQKCKENVEEVASKCEPVLTEFNSGGNRLQDTDTADLIAELKRRGDIGEVAEEMDDDALLDVMQARGIWPIFDARPTRLIHELRRQARNVSVENYYHDDKEGDVPHSSDKVGAEIFEQVASRETRRTKKRVVTAV
jgi:hypothetical protein